jgi:hypothetical protein
MFSRQENLRLVVIIYCTVIVILRSFLCNLASPCADSSHAENRCSFRAYGQQHPGWCVHS